MTAFISIDFDTKKDLWYAILKNHGVEAEDFFEAYEKKINLKHIPSIGDFLCLFIDISHCLPDYRDSSIIYEASLIEIIIKIDGMYWMYDKNGEFRSLEITGEFEG